MIRRMVCHPVVSLGLVITAILAAECSFAQEPLPGTPHLIFSTYLGGPTPCAACPDRTFGQNAGSDAQGNTYVTGATESPTLPVLNAFQPKPAPHSEMTAFVAKYDPAGRVLWLTYLGGNKQTMGVGVAAMPDGGVAVGGMTSSDGSGSESFPTRNAFQDHNNGGSDYFVTVFDANGNLRYSTYLGGSGQDGSGFTDDNSNGNNVAVDAHGLVYITGTTNSGGSNTGIKFPVTDNALQPDLKGATDSFVCIFDPAKSGADSLIYCSFLGGDRNEKGHSIAVNAAGDHITAGGYTDSDDFPTTPNAYRSHYAPGFTSNGFLSQFKSSKPGDPSSEYTARYSTYLGADSSDARDDLYGMVMDANGLIIATGRTQSADFPMTGPGTPFLFNSAPYLKKGVSNDQPYLVKIDPSLDGKASLVYSTFLGGGYKGYGSFCTSAGADSHGKAYVGGETNAPGVLYTPSPYPPPSVFVPSPTHFPYTADALITSLQGEEDVEFMQVTADGEQLGYSTYLGGTGTDRAYGLAVDPDGNVVVTGLTSSSDFPLKNPAQTYPGNNAQNAFIAKFSFAAASGNGKR
ncbi:MAG: SBBP repeat-containing protein [Candidatus Korobacteraceae bacterium]